MLQLKMVHSTPFRPDFAFAPQDPDFLRLSRRGGFGRQALVGNIAINPTDSGTIYTVETPSRLVVGAALHSVLIMTEVLDFELMKNAEEAPIP